MEHTRRLKPVGVVVTEEERKRLKMLAAVEGKTVSSFIRDLLLQHTHLSDDSFFEKGVRFSEQDTLAAER